MAEKKKPSWIARVLDHRFTGKRWFAIAGGSLLLVAFFVGVLYWPGGILSRPNLSPGADAALLGRSEALRLPGNGPAEVGDLSIRLLTQQDLQALVAKPRLKRLDLHDSSIDDEDLRIVANLKTLEWLDLSATLAATEYKPRITDAGLRHLGSLSRLRTLILHGLPVTDAGLEQLKSLSGLERLQLGGTLVTGEGLRHLTNLNWVRLDATPITDEGLRHLQATVGLEELYLDQTKVGNAGLRHLVGLRKLRTLNLHDTEVTPSGVAFLKKHLPALTVGVNPPAEPPQAGFLPIREVAFGRHELLRDCFLNLENGRLFGAPGSLVRQLAEQDHWHPGERLQALDVLDWLRSNRVDLMARTGRDGLTLVDGVAILVESRAPGVSAFETIEADHVLRTSAMLAATLAAYTNQQPQGLSIFWFDPRGATKTWIFRTRTGRAGALEILDDGRESGAMKIRYKLVKPLTTAYSTAMAAVRDAPPPMTAPATGFGKGSTPNGVGGGALSACRIASATLVGSGRPKVRSASNRQWSQCRSRSPCREATGTQSGKRISDRTLLLPQSAGAFHLGLRCGFGGAVDVR